MSRQAPLPSHLAAILVCILPMWAASQATGQVIFRSSTQAGRFIEAPRAIQQQIREAQRSLEQDEESDAVVRLGDLLQRDADEFSDSDLAGQDFFVEIEKAESGNKLVVDSLLRRARRMIGELSPAALETYELRYGPLARKILDDASQTRDWEAVRTVRRKFFHTKAGYEASFLLAQKELLGGHALSASLLLDDIVSLPRAVAHLGEGVVLMHASATKVAGRDASKVGAADDTTLIERYAESADFSGVQGGDYAMFGGGPDRNGNSAGQMPLTNKRWQLDTTANPLQERALNEVAVDLASTGKLPPPSWEPLRVGNQLLMRTTERLVGVDYKTGKRVWAWPWFSPVFDEEQLPLDSLGLEGQNDLLSQRVWNDVPYGQMTSDGKRVFMIDDLGEVETATFSPMGFGGTRPSDTSSNTLVALELATEGKLRWRQGAGCETSSELSNAFFLGPPLPLDGRLYVMHELAGDINLSCLDPATGSELWRQQLVAVESGGVEVDPIRRVAGATPTYHEGLLICPTGAGAIVAIDLADRMLRWGLSFDRNMEMIRSVSGRGGVETTQLMQRWSSGAAVASGDTLLVTPIESDRLFGLDVITGKRRFAEKNRVNLRYLAGARDGNFYVVGARQMRAFNMRTGASVWTTSGDMLAVGQQIVGRGVFGNGDYLLPTNSNQLIRVSLEDGTVLERRNTKYALGNLIAVDGQVIVQGASTISVAYGEASLEPLVKAALEKDPNDFEALVRSSELLIQRGQRRKALQLLARARDIEPSNDEVHMLSISAMLGELRDNLDANDDLVETLDQLIERPAERADFLALRIRSALANHSYPDLANHFIDLSNLLGDLPLLEGAADEIVGDVARHCSLDSWLASRVNEVATTAGESDLETVNSEIASAIERKLQGSDSLLSRIVRHFGVLQAVEPARAELANRFAKTGSTLKLERLALGRQVPTEEGYQALSNDRLLMLADSHASRGFKEDAQDIIKVLRSRDEGDLTQRLDQLSEIVKISSRPWPQHVALEWESQQVRSRGFSVPSQRVALTRNAGGKFFQNWQLVSEGTNPLAMRDPVGLLRPIAMEGLDRQMDGDKEAKISGSLMVIVLPTALIGVDLHHVIAGDGEAVMWRHALSADGSPIAKRRSETTPFEDQIVRYYIVGNTTGNTLPEFRLGPVLGDRIILLQGGDLMAIDLENQPLWRNSSAPRNGVVLAQKNRVAVVSPSSEEVAFFDVLDGAKLDAKHWTHGKVWAAVGTNVLCYEETDQSRLYNIKLINPFTDEVLLECQSSAANQTRSDVPCSYGRVTAGRYLVLLNNEGLATIWDLREGREIGRPQLAAYPDLQGLQTIALEDQLILLPKRRATRAKLPQATQVQTADGKNHTTVHAVHAISLKDGKESWGKQFENPWGCTLHQPATTPVLIFTRSPFSFNSPTGSRRKQLDALALDVRDGSVLDETLGKPILSTNNVLETRVTVQWGLSKVIAQVGGELLTYRFQDTPVKKESSEDLDQGDGIPDDSSSE